MEADQVRSACEAITSALRPRAFDEIARQARWPTADRRADVVFMLYQRITNHVDLERSAPFWDAYGTDLSVALTVVCDVDAERAGYLIGAALQAHIIAKMDLVPDAVLRLAERAACWEAGVEHAATRPHQ